MTRGQIILLEVRNGVHRNLIFAGRDDLEITRQYRDENKPSHPDAYGMVFDVPPNRGTS